MSGYMCSQCGEMKDSDYSVCVADPRDDTELICESCATEMDLGEDEGFTRAKEFSRTQQEEINRVMALEIQEEELALLDRQRGHR